MRRRALLRRTGALGAVGLAGCLSTDGSGSTPTSTPTDEQPTVDTTSIETRGTDCASGHGGVDGLDADAAKHRLAIEGTVRASNPCHLAEITAVELDDGTLTVTIGTVPDDQEVCVECVGEVDYRASIQLTAGLTAEVIVQHESVDGVEDVARETVEL